MRIILEPKNVWDKVILKYREIREHFNGMVMVKVEPVPFDEVQRYPGGVQFHSRTKVTPIIKWYRFSFIATRRFMEDYGEGMINGGFPWRFKRGWHDFDRDCWIWYLIPFHLIVPACKLARIWFYWKLPYWMEEKQKELNPSIEIIENLRRQIREEEWTRSFNFYESKTPLYIRMPENHEN